MWLLIAVGGLLFRTVHLFFIQGVQAGLVWFTKILTDPFHDILLYYKAPLYLMRGRADRPGTRQSPARLTGGPIGTKVGTAALRSDEPASL